MHRGYIKLYRAISDNPMWTERPFNRGQAWVDMILLANHKEGQIRARGIPLKVKRGQLGWSKKALAKRWGWSQGKVSRFLKELKNGDQIEEQNSNVTSLVTIINYEKYQASGDQNGEQTETKRGANGEQTGTNKKLKNEKNEKNKELLPEAYRLTDVLISKILSNKPDYRELQKDKLEKTRERFAEDIDKALRIDKRSPQEMEKIIIWCQEDSFWKSNILSGSKLRQQFDKLVLAKGRTVEEKKQSNGVDAAGRKLEVL